MTRSNSVVVWEGPSELNGAPIVLVLTGLARESDNAKTAAMVQSYILRADVHPVVAVRTGVDDAICGNCPLRPINAAAVDAALNARYPDGRKRPGAVTAPVCYVEKGKGPANVYRTYAAGRYPTVTPDAARALIDESGRPLRRGTYGDPAAVPVAVWESLGVRRGDTGYTHQWRTAPAALRALCMASVGSPAETAAAHAAGWRTFRVRGASDAVLPGESVCPASAEGGRRSHCADCGLCGGARPGGDSRRSIVIMDHGPTAPKRPDVRPLRMVAVR